MNPEITCPHCFAKNPPTAYCCLSCFKIMRPGAEMPFWKQHLKGNRIAIALGLFLGFILITSLHSWIQSVEAHMNTIEESTDLYNESLVTYNKLRTDQKKKDAFPSE